MVRDRLRRKLLAALAGDVAVEELRARLDRGQRDALRERRQDVPAERVRVVEDRRASPPTGGQVLVEELVDQRGERLVGRLAPAFTFDAIESLAELAFGPFCLRSRGALQARTCRRL